MRTCVKTEPHLENISHEHHLPYNITRSRSNRMVGGCSQKHMGAAFVGNCYALRFRWPFHRMGTVMIHVYEIPEKRSDGYCFNGGNPIAFLNVDWMNSPDEIAGMDPISDDEMLNFIRTKQYIKPGRKYLVLDRNRAFVIEGTSHDRP